MKKIIFCLMVMMAFTAAPVFGADGCGHDHGAHAGHDHGNDNAAELTQSQIQEKASGYVAKLVEKGKLDASWEEIAPKEVKENEAHEWVVTYANPQIEDTEKQTLYLFLSLSGKYIAANFTGK